MNSKIANKLYIKCFYRAVEITSHIKPNDFWVIFNQCVLDLSLITNKINETPIGDLTALHQLSMFGGSDLSKLFLEEQNNNLEMFKLKSNSEYGKSNDLFWWNDPSYIIGGITTLERNICVRDKSSGTQSHLTVCEEDSIYDIRAKFYNHFPEKSGENIIWRKTESTCCPDGHLFLDKTLTENGLKCNAKDEVVFLWMFHKDEFNACQNFM